MLNNLKERLNDISGIFSGFINKFGFLFEDAVNAWDEAHRSDYSDFPVQDASHKNDATENETNSSSFISQTIDRLNTQLKPAFASLQSAWQDIFTENGGFTLDNVDLSMLSSIKSAIDGLNSDTDINIGYSSFENLAKVLTDTSSTADDVKNSMNALAADVLNSLNPALSDCSGEQYLFLKSMLESVGIINSEEVLISSLGYSYDEYTAAKAEAAAVGFDLAHATEHEINSFVTEAIESGSCGKALALLQLKKRLVNSTSIDTASDIQEIMNLASAADVSSNVLTALASAQNILSQVESGNPISLASYEKALSDVENARKEMLDWKPVEVDFTTADDRKSSSALSNAKSAAESAEKAVKDYVDSYMNYMESSLDAGIIDYQNYVRKVSSFLKSMYDDGKIAAQDYFHYQRQMLETQKSTYDKALSAVTRRIDREIDGLRDLINGLEEQNETLEQQKDDYDSLLSVVDSVYEAEIDRIKSEQDAIQDNIDALQDENDERKLALKLEQAKYDLYKAQAQRTKKVFNGTEFVYETDKDAVRDAQETLSDLTLEQTVNGLEAEKNALDTVIEELEYYQSLWAGISDAYEDEISKQLAISMWGEDYIQRILSNQTSDIDSFKNDYTSVQETISANQELIDSYNEKIESYEALKEQWSSVADAYEQAQQDQYAAMILGAEWESDVLSGRLDTLERFRDEYISIQKSIADAALEYANAAASAASANESASSGTSGSPSGQSRTSKWVVVDESTGGSTQYTYTSKSDAEAKANALSAGIDDNDPSYYVREYASGTAHARKGLNLVGENGAETYIDNDGNVSLVTKPSLVPMEGGETVINAAGTKSMLSPTNLTPADIPAPGSSLTSGSAQAPLSTQTPSDTVTLYRSNGDAVQLNMDEFWQRLQNVMPDYSNMVRPMVHIPKYNAMPVENTTPVVQNITLTLPNVTNNSGYERIKNELRQMQIDAYQLAHRRR